jgi:hypothetical protein
MQPVRQFEARRLGSSAAFALMTALAPGRSSSSVNCGAQRNAPRTTCVRRGNRVCDHSRAVNKTPAGCVPTYPSFQNRNRKPMPRSSVLRWRNPLANPASTVWYITPA